ncbi:MAG: zinc-dependent metalloprotease [Bacteroidota bacterium]
MKSLLLLCLIIPVVALTQKLPSIEEKTKAMKKHVGFVNFYWNDDEGKVYLEIAKPGIEILYQTSLPAGVGSNDIGLDRGLLGETSIVKFTRTGRKILMTQPNYAFRANTNDVNEKRAVEQSFAQSTIWGFAVEAETGGAILVDATEFLLRDAMKVANRLRAQKQGSYSIDKTRSAIYPERTKNFPLNTELEASITFVNSDGTTGNYISSVAPTTDAITVRMHHSFVQLPDSNYEKRFFDPRSGFYNISYFDYSSPVAEPISKYLAVRHRLQKKDPLAAVSEAVKPIVYYVDNGTPEPIRSALLEGAFWWNQAFEAAGFKNAFQVKLLPDSADPMDLRYNTINWVHRSTRGWSYGAAVVDPRTGEIIKGNVSLGSLRVRQDYLIAQGLLAPFENGSPVDDKMLKMALDRLKQLSAHEVGHTLGLMHNYSASTIHRSSVMDYPHPLATITNGGRIDLTNAYDLKIGDWDKLAITWGYSEFPNKQNEAATLNSLLVNGYKNGLRFLTDQDARPPGSTSPNAHLWDNGSSAVDELSEVMKVRSMALKNFGEKNIRSGTPLAMLEDVLVPVYFYHRYQLEAVTKIIGGLDYSYTLKGDGALTTKAIPKEEQLKALNAVIASIDPKILVIPSKIVALIAPRPAGYDASRELFTKRTGLAFDALSPAETAVDFPLSFLFNPQRLSRMVQYETSGGLGVSEMINLLVNNTWKAPRRIGMEKLVQQQTEQVLLTYLLALSINENASYQARADVKKALSDLKTFITGRRKTITDPSYSAHLLFASERMEKPEEAKPTIHKEIPPGAPIGCDAE